MHSLKFVKITYHAEFNFTYIYVKIHTLVKLHVQYYEGCSQIIETTRIFLFLSDALG